MSKCDCCGKEIVDGLIIEGSGLTFCEESSEGVHGACLVKYLIDVDKDTEEVAKAHLRVNQLVMDDSIDIDDESFRATLSDVEITLLDEMEEEYIFYTTFDEYDEE